MAREFVVGGAGRGEGQTIVRDLVPQADNARIAFLRAHMSRIEKLRESIPLLPLTGLEGEDLLLMTSINAHASKALASLAMAAEDTAHFLENMRGMQQRRNLAELVRCFECRAQFSRELASSDSKRWTGVCPGCDLEKDSLAHTFLMAPGTIPKNLEVHCCRVCRITFVLRAGDACSSCDDVVDAHEDANAISCYSCGNEAELHVTVWPHKLAVCPDCYESLHDGQTATPISGASPPTPHQG